MAFSPHEWGHQDATLTPHSCPAGSLRRRPVLDSPDVRRDFRAAIGRARGIDADDWTPREMRHSFVSLLSDSGVPIEEISRLVGHKSTLVTEVVYRKQLRPVIQSGATVMDQLFAGRGNQSGNQETSDTREPGSLAGGTGL